MASDTYGAPRVAPDQPPEVREGLNSFGQADAPLAAFGGGPSQEGVQRAASGIASEVERVAEIHYHNANNLAVLDADRQMNDVETSIMYDPKTGLLSKKGKDAMGAYQPAMDQFRQKASEISSSLTNDEQRNSFAHVMNARQMQLERIGQRHVSNEMQSFDRDTTDASVQNSIDRISQNYDDPVIVGTEMNKMKAVLTDYSSRQGIAGSPAQDKIISDAVTKAHAGVIGQYLNSNQSFGAEAYFNKNKDEIADPRVQSALKEKIDRQIPVDLGSMLYDQMSSSAATTDKTGALDMTQVPDAIDAEAKRNGITLSPEQKKSAYSTIEQSRNQDLSALKQQNEANSKSFFSQLADSKSDSWPVSQKYQLAEQSANRFMNGQIDQDDLLAKKNFIDGVGKASAVKDDNETLFDLRGAIDRGDITSIDPITKAASDGLLSAATARKLSRDIQTGNTAPMKQAWKDIVDSATQRLGNKSDVADYVNALHEQYGETGGADPAALRELDKKNQLNVRTPSAANLWNMFSSKTVNDVQQELHKNSPELVKALGYQKAQDLVGTNTDAYADGSPRARAAILLKQNNLAVTDQNIDSFLAKNPKF
jgi:hypothetical protein